MGHLTQLSPFADALTKFVLNGVGTIEDMQQSVATLQKMRDDETISERSRIRAAEGLLRIADSVAAKSLGALQHAAAEAKNEADANQGTGRVTVNIRPIAEKPPSA